MIISLEKGKYIGKMLNLVVPLPRLKPCGTYVQGAIADETRKNYTYNVYKSLPGLRDFAFEPIPVVRSVEG